MPHLFTRLFRYHQTEGRTPTEDFLSELLGDFLERAPQEIAVQIIIACFIPETMAAKFRCLIANNELDIRTQVRIPNGKVLDILIEAEGRPLIVIENKIGAAFQRHARLCAEESETEDELEHEAWYDHQLVTYGSWLHEENEPDEWPGVLAVLTHTALTPPDFLPAGANRYGAVPHQCYWRGFHSKLWELVGDGHEPLIPAWTFVGREICNFLKDRNMDSSYLSSVDIAAINVSMEAGRRLRSSFDEIHAELLHRHSNLFVAKGTDIEVSYEDSRMWGWTYFSGSRKIYLGYGIHFVPLLGAPETAVPPLPDQEHAFIVVGSDKAELSMSDDHVPATWSCVEDGWSMVKPFPLSARLSGERFPQFLLRIIESEFATITALHDAYQGSSTAAG